MSTCDCYSPRPEIADAAEGHRLQLFNRITAILLLGWVVVVGLAAEYATQDSAQTAQAVIARILG